jgi:DNA-binding beta-propeller fold protein YncE
VSVALLGACVSSNDNPAQPAADGGQTADDAGHAQTADTGPGTTEDAAPATEAGAASPPVSVSTITVAGLTSPQHIAIDPTTGNVYVASFAGSYSVLSPTGTLLGTYGATGTPHLTSPVGIALDSQGNVYVGDYGASVVMVFDSSGTYKATFDGSASGVTLGRLAGVAVDATGAIYAADDDNGRIVKFDSSGNVTGQIATVLDGGGSLGTTGIAFDGTNMWVSKYYDHAVEQIDSAGAIVASYGTLGTSGALGTFSQPYAIAVGPGHVVYVADNADNDVQALTTGGVFLWTESSAGDAGPVNPSGLAASKDGTKLYVSDGSGDRVVVYTLGQ